MVEKIKYSLGVSGTDRHNLKNSCFYYSLIKLYTHTNNGQQNGPTSGSNKEQIELSFQS